MKRCAVLLAILPCIIGCDAAAEGPLTADGVVLHLEEHLADATVIGSEVPADLVESVDWEDEKLLAEWHSYEGDGKANWLAREPTIVSAGDGAIRIEVDEEKKWEVVERALEHFKKSHEVIDVDGARVLFGDGWGLLRTSNTQPVIVARFEARTEERLKEIQGTMEDWLATQGVHV